MALTRKCDGCKGTAKEYDEEGCRWDCSACDGTGRVPNIVNAALARVPVRLALRPGRAPDTPKGSDAGETWRYLGAVEHPKGDTALQNHTVAMLYRYVGHPEIADGWHWSYDGRGDGACLEYSRAEASAEVESWMRADGWTLANDPARSA